MKEKFAYRMASKDLRRVFQQMDINGDGAIDTKDLKQYLKSLGYETKKGEAEEYIWEVDDRLKGSIDYEIFERTFQRCWQDKAGIEPRQLYNVILFALNAGCGAKRLPSEAAMRLVYFEKGKVRRIDHGASLYLDSSNTMLDPKIVHPHTCSQM